jgi:glycosyltransferase involved in cell wall biosynthesis/SAM-dependent methyltransferase
MSSIVPASYLVSDNTKAQPLAVFTICSKNFTAYAKTLFDSVSEFHPEAEQYMCLCDEVDSGYDPALLPFNTILLRQLEIPGLEGMAERYNITEFNTAIKPFVFNYLFNKLGKQNVVYIDPDIILTSRMEEVIDAFANGAECILTPHILRPAEDVEVHDQNMLKFGIYNLGFLGLRHTDKVVEIVEWWSRRLRFDCVIQIEEGLFVDQKWADLFPAFIPGTVVLHHDGYNVAYWNLSQRQIKRIDGKWYANEQPLRFVHFSGNKLADPHVFSRHARSFNRDNIGDLKYLLDLYRERVYANGHADYSKLPYSFNWNGATGFNKHTPKPYSVSSVKVLQSARGLVRRLWSYCKYINTASRLAGGWGALVSKVIRVFRRGGFAAIKQRTRNVKSIAEIMQSSMIKAPLGLSTASQPEWMPRLLFIDWSTPRPDRDAGSLTAFHLLKIYVDLGYNVTFIPSDLQFFGEYTASIRALGVRCLHREDVVSVKNHLKMEGENYKFVLICRAPVAEHYIADIRQFAPNAKIILNTSDLHYLREVREAEVAGTAVMIEAAKRAKEWELDILRKCDEIIVMSSVELEILKGELPSVDVRLIPLMFVETAYDCPPYEEREDFLFIGGFPHTPNVDAVVYFCNEILPLVRISLPDIKFHIIGNSPPPQVLALANLPGVIIHGYMRDISPMFRACKLSVAPLRYGAGIKGKIGTSLAYGVPVVATSIAVEGMEIEAGQHVLVADTPQQFADAIVHLYKTKDAWTRLSENGRDRMLQTYSPAAGYRRISMLMKDIDPQHKQIDLYTLRSFQEYELLVRAIREDILGRAAVERALIKHDQPNFFIKGFCATCGCESMFNASFMYSYETTEDGNPIPNWREHLDCVNCGLNNRIRAAMHMFYSRVKPADDAAIYITEQTTSLYRWLKERHPSITGSEYFGDAVPFGAEKAGLRNEDLTALTFADKSFDYILSFDVMEHVGDDIAALREVYRCLKPGGTFLFAAPFAKERERKLVRARMISDGSIEHIMPPEYHGNPVDHENGALCFRYFAWDLIDDMKAAGFKDPMVLHYWSRDFAYLGGEQFMFVGQKPV